jgi:hypothetical protein
MGDDDEASESSLAARDQVFSIVELVSLVLHQVDTLTLITCQHVCRQWKAIIDDTQTLQALLFRTSATSSITTEEGIVFHPILRTHFCPLFAFEDWIYPCFPDKRAWVVHDCEYRTLFELRWARDGCSAEAFSQQAYARPEASWRNMLISQPPVTRLDWQHTWNSEKDDRMGGLYHQQYTKAVTIGMLWDLLEALLIRGCRARIIVLPTGGDMQHDSFFSEGTKSSARQPEMAFAFPGPDTPRMILQTHHWWPGDGPEMYQVFGVQKREWAIFRQIPFKRITEERLRKLFEHSGNGFEWLMIDCERDTNTDNSSVWRWSKSDASERATLIKICSTRWLFPRRV